MLHARGLLAMMSIVGPTALHDAVAQGYPARPIRVITAEPGGGNDFAARTIGQAIAPRLGQQWVVDNRGGAGGMIAAEIAAKAAPDGYTLLVYASNIWIIPLLRRDINYSMAAFAPITWVARAPNILVVHPSLPVASVPELIEFARAQPGKLNAGTGGQAGPGHLALELLRSMAGVDIVHVPFKGGAAATTALLGEQIDIVIDGSAMGQVKAGKLRAIAVTGPRLPALPDVPGIGETVKGYEFTNWWGILAPAGTPSAVVDRVSRELSAIAELPDVRERLSELGLAARGSSPKVFTDLLRTVA